MTEKFETLTEEERRAVASASLATGRLRASVPTHIAQSLIAKGFARYPTEPVWLTADGFRAQEQIRAEA